MKKLLEIVAVTPALCAMALFAQSAAAQSPDVNPPIHGTRATLPQLRAPQKVEKSPPKIQSRANAATAPMATVAAGPAVQLPQPQPQPQPAAPPGSETQNFQGWTVTCLPVPPDNSARTCVAKMGVLKSNEDRRPILFMSVVKSGGSATFVLQTPTGIDLKSGATIQIGKAPPRHLTYESCEPALCTATVQMDDPFVQELASSPSATATWVGLGVGEVRVEYALQEARNTLAYLVSK